MDLFSDQYNNGETVKHRLTGEIMIIKKSFGNVCTCILKTPIIIWNSPYLETQTIVCHKNNLVKIS
jgi:hypothetical protein